MSLDNLHSTMYLLKRLSASISDIIVLDLHSTMYLLKLSTIAEITSFYSVFTFHYVSIKTRGLK